MRKLILILMIISLFSCDKLKVNPIEGQYKAIAGTPILVFNNNTIEGHIGKTIFRGTYNLKRGNKININITIISNSYLNVKDNLEKVTKYQVGTKSLSLYGHNFEMLFTKF